MKKFYIGYTNELGHIRKVDLVYTLNNKEIEKYENLISFTTSYADEEKLLSVLKEIKLVPENIQNLFYVKEETLNNVTIQTCTSRIYTAKDKDYFNSSFIEKTIIENIDNKEFRNDLFGFLLKKSGAVINIFNSFVSLGNGRICLDKLLEDLKQEDISSELYEYITYYLNNKDKNMNDVKSYVVSNVRKIIMTNNKDLYAYFRNIYDPQNDYPYFVSNILNLDNEINNGESVVPVMEEIIRLIQNVIYKTDENDHLIVDERRICELGEYLLKCSEEEVIKIPTRKL